MSSRTPLISGRNANFSERKSFRASKEMLQELKELSEKTGIKQPDLIRIALSELLQYPLEKITTIYQNEVGK